MPGRGRSHLLDPEAFDALLFDLDGVVTRTAAVHAEAWKRLFDEYLAGRAERRGVVFEPFDIERDYRTWVDGRPRYDGVRSFLESRGISLPHGAPRDDPGAETICGLGNRKNEYFNRLLRQGGVEVFESTVALVQEARSRGMKVAVVSSSKNCADVLDAAGLADLFEARVDGVEVERLGLRGKPAPDMFLEAARRISVEPGRAVVFEDAVSGVQAGRAGGFGLVVGVDRAGQAGALRDAGADIVVSDLAQIALVPAGRDRGRGSRRVARGAPSLPSALERLDEIAARAEGRRLAVFLDYDGTLTPIVARPELATMSEEMRAAVRDLAGLCSVAIVSGRDRADVEDMVRLDSLFYAGSHGFDIAGPGGRRLQHDQADRFVAALREAAGELRRNLGGTPGVIVEEKKYAVAVHYRLVHRRDVQAVKDAVGAVAARHPGLRKTGGKKVLELRPRVDWDKGKAVLWLLRALDLDAPDVLPVYLGDDETDEDAFAALRARGIGILVAEAVRPTHAGHLLRDPDEVRLFLQRLARTLEGRRA